MRKTTGLKNLVNAVSERRLLTVLEAKKKPRRTLKRRPRGNSAAFKKARQTGTKTRRTKKKSRKANAVRDKCRTPRARKKIKAQSVIASQNKSAYSALQKAKWLWNPRLCGCGGKLFLCLWAQDCATAWCWQMFLQMHRV